jgi:hypothetical protein
LQAIDFDEVLNWTLTVADFRSAILQSFSPLEMTPFLEQELGIELA